jgi:predicted dehydrogenase
MDKLRVATIGAGAMANRVHYPALAELDQAEIVAVCDLDEKRLHETADRYEVAGRYTNYRLMLEQSAPQAVFVVLPPMLLFPVVMHILSCRLNVFIEKPPGLTHGQTYHMARAAERNNCLTMVGFNRRFIPLLREARRVVEERGPILQAMATFYKNGVGQQPTHGGEIDLLTFDVIHAVDTLRWLGGEVREVVSDIRRAHADYDNSFNALLRFENGALGTLSALWVAGARVHTFEIHAKGISAFVDPNNEARILADQTAVYAGGGRDGLATAHALTLKADEVAGSTDFSKTYGYFAEDQHFIECVTTGRQPDTNFADAVKSVELLERIRRNQYWPRERRAE